MTKYGEIRALIGGGTAIQGSPNRKCLDTIIRNVDHAKRSGWEDDPIRTYIRDINSVDEELAEDICEEMDTGETRAWLIHLAEGIDQKSLYEFSHLEELCLFRRQTTIIHGTALTKSEFAAMADAGLFLIWSPQSNINLYGGTTDIETALKENVNMALAPDWSLSGSCNILESLQYADQLNRVQFHQVLSDQKLVNMVTVSAAAAMGINERVGSLMAGYEADITVIKGNPKAPYRSLIEAGVEDVMLVFVDGIPLYGEKNFSHEIRQQHPAGKFCEELDVCGKKKIICVKTSESSEEHFDESLEDIKSILGEMLREYDMELTPLFHCKE